MFIDNAALIRVYSMCLRCHVLSCRHTQIRSQVGICHEYITKLPNDGADAKGSYHQKNSLLYIHTACFIIAGVEFSMISFYPVLLLGGTINY